MCLTTKDPTIKIAQEDIIVYKTLAKVELRRTDRTWLQKLFGTNKYRIALMSEVYRTFEYKIGELCPQQFLDPLPVYHVPNYPNACIVERGYHSDVDRLYTSNAIFIIPKGTKYIEGYFNDQPSRANYVSETIILKELI